MVASIPFCNPVYWPKVCKKRVHSCGKFGGRENSIFGIARDHANARAFQITDRYTCTFLHAPASLKAFGEEGNEKLVDTYRIIRWASGSMFHPLFIFFLDLAIAVCWKLLSFCLCVSTQIIGLVPRPFYKHCWIIIFIVHNAKLYGLATGGISDFYKWINRPTGDPLLFSRWQHLLVQMNTSLLFNLLDNVLLFSWQIMNNNLFGYWGREA